jgi:hypothetical protein
MIRKIAFAVMVVLAIVSILEGQLALALLFGGLKALIVGLEYMELRSAARPHAVGFVLAVAALTIGLVGLT